MDVQPTSDQHTTQQPEAEEVLGEEEVRVLGCLIEKSYTTPDAYPLTINATINACNQKSSRFPVVYYEEHTVRNALENLRDKGWVVLVHTAGARTLKYKHNFRQHYNFSDQEIAILCVLMLRGPQTCGELRSRTDRIVRFKDLAEVEETISELESGYPCVFVKKLPVQVGRKENRFVHLFGGDVELPPDSEPATPLSSVSRSVSRNDERFEAMEQRMDDLHEQLNSLQVQFQAFRAQFD